MTQLKPTFGKTVTDAKALAAALGVDAVDGRAPSQEVNCGSNFFIVPLPTRKAVDAAVLDRAKVDAVFAAAGIQRRGIYVFSVESAGDDVTAYSRMLPSGGIEDPATGSAVGPAGCFAARYGFVPPDRIAGMTFLQGVLARRPSRLHVKVAMTGSDVTGVQVGGASVVVGEGTMAV
jgi:trans-2,3-dihydro-3-hydroxyanthranilate isomerase